MVNGQALVSPWEAAASVVDPEIRAVTIEELGILRGVEVDQASGRVTVTITPTYSGCPAMDVIRADIRAALRAAGHRDVEVITALGAPWSTDWITDAGRQKLAAAGIAPPGPVRQHPGGAVRQHPGGAVRQRGGAVPLTLTVRCPRCGSPETEELSRFGSTACKALWRCRGCLEPFDRVKPL
jgi:ring-1,2-phenylacetyl-CoA epoxidase subunit PaaD